MKKLKHQCHDGNLIYLFFGTHKSKTKTRETYRTRLKETSLSYVSSGVMWTPLTFTSTSQTTTGYNSSETKNTGYLPLGNVKLDI